MCFGKVFITLSAKSYILLSPVGRLCGDISHHWQADTNVSCSILGQKLRSTLDKNEIHKGLLSEQTSVADSGNYLFVNK